MSYAERVQKTLLSTSRVHLRYLGPAEFDSFIGAQGLRNRVLEHPKAASAAEHTVRIVTGTGQNACAICLMPASYHHGEATSFDPGGAYVNQVQFLGYNNEQNSERIATLISQALFSDRQVLLSTRDETLAAGLPAHGFVRVSARGDAIQKYALSPTSHTTGTQYSPTLTTPAAIQFDDADQFYYHELARLFAFDFEALVHHGWTVYERENHSFIFTLTVGRNSILDQQAFRIDVYESEIGLFSGYCDVHVPAGITSVFSDVPAVGMTSAIPAAVCTRYPQVGPESAKKANWTRTLWRNREGLWVHLQNRRMGIGRSLIRIACDLSRYLFGDKQRMQVSTNYVELDAYRFHRRIGARRIHDGLYQLAYDLRGKELPLIAIRYHK